MTEDGERAFVGFIFNKREMEMPARVRTRALSGCIIINGDRCIFHAAPHARAFTLRRERNEWMYTARTVITVLIITRRKIGLRRCNKCARERNKRRVRMTNCQTISVPSSAVIKDGTTINPITTSLVPVFPPSSRRRNREQSGTTTKKLSPKRTQFLAIRCGITTGTRDTRARYYVSRESRCSTSRL